MKALKTPITIIIIEPNYLQRSLKHIFPSSTSTQRHLLWKNT